MWEDELPYDPSNLRYWMVNALEKATRYKVTKAKGESNVLRVTMTPAYVHTKKASTKVKDPRAHRRRPLAP
jgi:hypothetical protein